MKIELQDMIDDCTSELNDIECKINALPPLDKTKSYLTKYALIKVSGTVEYVYRSIVADYFDQFSVPQIDHYLEKKVRTGSSSAKYEMMKNLLEQFDSAWGTTFKNKINGRSDGQQLIDASNSLVNNRHSFAHGKEPTATFSDIKQYYLKMLDLIAEFDSVVK